MATMDKPEAALELPVDASLEEPQEQPRPKGLVKRGAFIGVAVALIVLLVLLAIRDLAGQPAASAAKPAAAASAPLAIVTPPNPGDIEKLAKEQANEFEKAAATASTPATSASSPGVSPAIPRPGVAAPMNGNPGAPLPGARPGQNLSTATGQQEAVVAAAAEAQQKASRWESPMIAVEGEEQGAAGGVPAVVRDMARVAGVDPTQTAVAEMQRAQSDAVAQQQEMIKALAQAGRGGTSPQSATQKDVQWLRDFQQGEASADVAPVTRAKRLPTRTVLLQGTRVPAVTLEAINSDMPGTVSARSTADIYDSLDQRVVLMPRGTRFDGRYSSEIRPGQTRVLLAFSRAVLPDGRIVDLGGAQGVDNLGRAGVEGNVNNHFLKMFGYSVAIAWMGNKVSGQGLTTTTTGNGQTTTSSVAGEVLADVSRQILQRNAQIPPTITKPVAEPFFITITKDVALEPWGSK